jgi:putative NADPH-quinone reductase
VSVEVLLLLAHPRPGSFNHAVAARVAGVLRDAGAVVHLHDLYAEGFDPLARPAETHTSGPAAAAVRDASDDPLLRLHRERLGTADALVAVHPNWWGKPPAILSGWLDRVLVPGVAYALDDAGGPPTPLIALRRLLVVNTSDTTAEREATEFGDPLDLIWRRCVAPYVGSPETERLVLRVVSDADDVQRATWLDEVAAAARRLLT